MPQPTRYTRTAIVLHWLMAALVLGTFVLGLWMADLPNSPLKLRSYNWHKWAGITILALSALRLAWRLTHRPPADLPMPAWQVQVAHWTHRGLYLLFFAVPLAGWAYTSAAGFPVVLFGVLPLPDFVPVDKPLSELLKGVHEVLAWTLATLAALHVAGALKHQIVDKDGLLERMRPGRAG